jgi:hypothetical protein
MSGGYPVLTACDINIHPPLLAAVFIPLLKPLIIFYLIQKLRVFA